MKKIALLIASVCLASSVFAADTATATKPTATKLTPIASAPVAQTPAVTASAPKVLTAQQNKMVTCNKSATGIKGDERKAFMSNCLKKTPTATTAPATTVTPAASSPVSSTVAPAASKAK